MKVATLVALAALAASCGGSPPSQANNVGSTTPTPAASASSSHSPSAPTSAGTSPSPPAVTTPYGVLVGSQAASTYTVSVVAVDGKVVASTQSTTPPQVSCANAAAAVVPLPVSTSNSGVYYEEAQGGVTYLSPDGSKRQAASVPAGTGSRRSMFAVSPDDSRIAVVVADFNSSGASTRLYVEDLGGTNHVDLFSETGAYSLWPIGWHGSNNLVVAKVPACTQGGGPFCCGPLELHVVDPATANRRFTLGGPSCVIAGTPSPAGVLCENNPSFTQGTWLNWTAGTVRNLALNGAAFAYVSPGGQFVAFVDNNGTSFTIGAPTIAGMFACEWIDDNHVLSGGDAQHQPRVANATTSAVVPVAAPGDCGGRLPGGLYTLG